MKIFSCKHATRLVSESLDRPLSRRESWTLRLHLSMCALCSRFRAQLMFLSRVAAQSHDAPESFPVETGETLSADAKARILQALSDR